MYLNFFCSFQRPILRRFTQETKGLGMMKIPQAKSHGLDLPRLHLDQIIISSSQENLNDRPPLQNQKNNKAHMCRLIGDS